MTLTAYFVLYNDELFLEYALASIVDFVDQIVVVDGSIKGPSTDRTPDIVSRFKSVCTIDYETGTFVRDDGRWDNSAQANTAISLCTSDFIMRVDGDEVHDTIQMERLRIAVDKAQTKKLLCYQYVNFFADNHHIRVDFDGCAMGHPKNKNSAICRRDAIIPFDLLDSLDGLSGDLCRYNLDLPGDVAFVHDVFRYHYGWTKPFGHQVERHVRNLTLGGWGEKMMNKSESDKYRWAIDHVRNEYDNCPMSYQFIGDPPNVIGDRFFSYMEGHESAIAEYEHRFGKIF